MKIKGVVCELCLPSGYGYEIEVYSIIPNENKCCMCGRGEGRRLNLVDLNTIALIWMKIAKICHEEM